MNEKREEAIHLVARSIEEASRGRERGELDADAAHRLAREWFNAIGLVAVPPELVEAVREADALVERLEAPHRRGDGVLEFKRMEDAIPIDRAQAEANERRQELADAVLAQLRGKP